MRVRRKCACKYFELRVDTAKEVGGDFDDFYLRGEDHLAFLIADVSGKGIPAAMFMMSAKSVLKSLAESGMPLEAVFRQGNQRLCEGNDTGMFLTVWMGVMNTRNGLLRFIDLPLHRRRDRGQRRAAAVLRRGAPAVGTQPKHRSGRKGHGSGGEGRPGQLRG
ncbi:MAG: SpoIIE family protein phosphatase [Clostridia bacterium]|nr:SpoIIE family protein phosphatase [Clostridia bacterium]